MSYLVFDGANDYATFPHFQDPASGSWTFILVFSSDGVESVGKVLMSQNGSLNRTDWLAHVPDGSLATNIVGNVPIKPWWEAGPPSVGPITPDTWYMASLRRDFSANSTTLNLRRTGFNSELSVAGNVPAISDGFHTLGISSFDFPTYEASCFGGKTAYMMHYNRRLSNDEMALTHTGVKAILAARGISL